MGFRIKKSVPVSEKFIPAPIIGTRRENSLKRLGSTIFAA